MDTDKLIEEGCGDCTYGDSGYECIDPREAIECFWATNIAGEQGDYNFDHNLDMLKRSVERKLAEHGLLGPDEYRDVIWEIYGEVRLEYLSVDTDFITITEDEIAEYVSDQVEDDPRYEATSPYIIKEYLEQGSNEELMDYAVEYTSERLADRFRDMPTFSDMMDVYEKLQSVRTMDRTEKALLFDEVIHTEHVHGSVFSGIHDIEEVREEFEERVTGI